MWKTSLDVCFTAEDKWIGSVHDFANIFKIEMRRHSLSMYIMECVKSFWVIIKKVNEKGHFACKHLLTTKLKKKKR